jgi:hypothetical protein
LKDASRVNKNKQQKLKPGIEKKKKKLIEQKSNTKRVEIEDGFKEPSPFANFDGVAHDTNKDDLQSTRFGSEAGDTVSAESIGGKTNGFDSLT